MSQYEYFISTSPVETAVQEPAAPVAAPVTVVEDGTQPWVVGERRYLRTTTGAEWVTITRANRQVVACQGDSGREHFLTPSAAANCLFTEGPAEAEPVQWVPAVGERVRLKIVPDRLGTVTRILGEPPWVWVAWDEGYEAEYTPNQLEPSLEAAPTPVLEEAPAPAPITPLYAANGVAVTTQPDAG